MKSVYGVVTMSKPLRCGECGTEHKGVIEVFPNMFGSIADAANYARKAHDQLPNCKWAMVVSWGYYGGVLTYDAYGDTEGVKSYDLMPSESKDEVGRQLCQLAVDLSLLPSPFAGLRTSA